MCIRQKNGCLSVLPAADKPNHGLYIICHHCGLLFIRRDDRIHFESVYGGFIVIMGYIYRTGADRW